MSPSAATASLVAEREGYALSPQQSRLWRLHAAGAPGIATVRIEIAISGPLSPDVLRAAMEGISARHEILRTTFHLLPGLSEPVQIPGTAEVEWMDGEDCEAPFDLAAGPPLRAQLRTLAPTRHQLVLTLPTLCADTGTAGVLLSELAAALGGEHLPENPLQYAQYCEWQSQLLNSAEGALARDFWRRSEGEAAGLGRLPYQREISDPASGNRDLAVELPGALGADDGPLLCAAWRVLLARLAGEEQSATGFVANGRKYAELDAIPGPFATVLPLRRRLDLSLSFAEVVADSAAAMAEALEWLEGRDPQDNETFAAGFELIELPKPLEAGGVRLRVEDIEASVDRFPLLLSIVQRENTLLGRLRWDPRAIAAPDAERCGRMLTTLLQSAVANPHTAARDLEILDAAERRRLVVELNATAAPYPEHLTLDRLFAEQAARTPDLPAVVAGERRIAFAPLADQVERIAGRLRRAGVGPETVVGLLAEPSPDLIAALLGILRAGGAYMPLDPSHPAERTAFMLADAGAALLLAEEGLTTSLPVPGGIQTLLDADWKAPQDSPLAGDPGALPDNLACVLYTSGSTGRPKGTLVTHRGMVNYLAWAIGAYGMDAEGGAPLHSSVAFDLTVTSLFGPLLAGRPVVLPARPAPGVESLAALVREPGGFGFIKLTPGHSRLLARQLPAVEKSGAARVLILGGEVLTAGDVAAWRQAAPRIRICNEYGPTETVVGCCCYELGTSPWEGDSIPIGRPIANARVFLLDYRLRLVPPGAPGEIFIGGPGVARGYLGRPRLTAERFVPDPFGNGERLYRTGDLGRLLPDGALEFLGRIDDQVKVRGYRVEPGEIEAVLASHPAVAEAAVAVRGAVGEERLVAWLVPPTGGDAPATDALRTWLASKLPPYMLPASFATIRQLPLTPNGKIDRQALPDPEEVQGDGYNPPRTLQEEILAGVWSQTLAVDRVGIDDDFFALGGDSIRSIPVVSLAAARGLVFSIDQLFRHRTIRRLALALQEAEVRAAPCDPGAAFDQISELDRGRVPADAEDAYPLSRLQAGMIFHLQASPESGVYHDIFSYRLRAPLDAEVLGEALAGLVGRHPALRTRFALTGFSEPLQIVHRLGPVPFEVHDLRSLPRERNGEVIDSLIAAERRRGFDPGRLPLFRVAVHRWSDDEFQFTFSFHHAILDGWSDAAMLIELAVSYAAKLRGEEPPYEPPVTRHRDFVRLERQALADAESERFWRARLRDLPPAALPRRRAGKPGVESPKPVWRTVPVTDEQSEQIKRLARRAAVPVKSVLLAAHLRALAVLTGQADILTCVTANGRPEAADGERVLGLFLNSMPLRMELAGGSWLSLIQRAFAAEREALPYRRFPLVEMQSWTAGRRLAEASFYFTHYHIVGNLDRFPELEVLDIRFHEATSFPLVANFHVDAFSAQVRVELTADGNLFDDDEIDRMAGVYTRVLHAMIDDPGGRYDQTGFLAPEETRELLARWDACETPDAFQAVHDRIAAQARRTPAALAIEHPGGSWTFADLDRASLAIARRLRARGIRPESVIAVELSRSPELVAALLGVLRIGAAYLPIDPAAPRERTAWMIADAGALPLELAASQTPEDEDPEPLPRTARESLAYVIYTSGSTGRPKGVLVHHGGLAAYLDWATTIYTPVGVGGGGAPLHSSVAFDLAVTSLFVPLLAGRPVRLAPAGEGAGPLAQALRDTRGFDFVKLTPSHARLLAAAAAASQLSASARALILGGEALRGEDLDLWRKTAPEVLVYNEYGPTETVVGCAVHAAPAGALPDGPVPIGRPIRGTRLLLLDRFLQPVPPGAPGELYVGGAGVARGYLGRPDLTAERFVPDPYGGNGERLYRTGDLASEQEAGTLGYLGRIDQQVKIRGFRIEPAEVEAALMSHPAVRAAAVLARPDADGGQRLVAWLVPAASALPPLEELRAFLASRLPEPMIPTVLVPVSELPLSPSGKLDPAALPEPGDSRLSLATRYAPPRTETEEVLAGLWSRVLGVDRVGIDDDYFTLGGDSIRSLQVVAQAREKGLALTMDALFRQHTVRRLAEALVDQQATASEVPPTEPFSLLTPEDRARMAAGVADAYPLSRLQAGMIYHRELHRRAAIYHDIMLSHLRVPFDEDLLRQALGALVDRHPALRTTFELDGFSQPLQLVHRQGVVHLEVRDLRGLSAAEQEDEIAAWVGQEQQRGFDLAALPLIRFAVHRRTGETLELAVSFHHAILDGWSDAMLHTELGLSYLALQRGEPIPFAPPMALYRDFVALEQAALDSPAARGFFLDLLAGGQLLEVPRRRSGEPAEAGERGVLYEARTLPRDLQSALERVARRATVPLKSVLLAAHLRALAFLGGRTDVLTTMVSSGRLEGRDGQRALGLFLNSLPVRAQVAVGSWEELIQAAFASELGSLPYRRFPFAEVQRLQGGGRLAETAFYFTHYHIFQQLADHPELEVLAHSAHEETSFTLVANFHQEVLASRLQFQLTADRTQLGAGELRWMSDVFLRALEGIAADAMAPIDSWSPLSETERWQAVVGWNRTETPFASDRCLHELIVERLAIEPDAVAVRCEGEDLTCRELDRRSALLARRLRARGAGPEKLVGVCLPRSLDLVVALLAVLRSGAAYLPLDPDHPAERLAALREDAFGAASPLLLTAEDLEPEGDGAAETPIVETLPENPAYVIYTSGSTGRPKGVVNTHRGIVNRLAWMQEAFQITPGDRVLHKTPLTFDVSVWEIFWPLLAGARLIVARPGGHRDPSYLSDLIAAEAVTTVHFVPSLLAVFLEEQGIDERCRSLRRVIASGEALTQDLARRCRERLAGAEIHNLYGPTEAAVDVSWWPYDPADAVVGVPIGLPIANLRLYVADPGLQPLPPGVPGEILIGGVGLARGYLKDPARTAAAFIPDPFAELAGGAGGAAGGRLYRTGDLGRRRPGGEIEFLGRLDHQVKIRGVRIEPGEVEAALAAHPDVVRAAVVPCTDGAGSPALAAYVVPRAGASLLPEMLRRHLQTRLSEPMIPAFVVLLPDLPLTPSGKLDRLALPAPAAAPAAARAASRTPRSPAEELLTRAWAESLGLDHAGVEDDFFLLGGHSLTAMRLVARLRAAFGIDLAIGDLFAAPTPARLAPVVEARLRHLDRSDTPPLAPAPRQGELPLSFSQQRLWFLDQLAPGNPFYNVPGAVRLSGRLDRGALASSFAELVRRHEVLRTVFPAVAGRPVQEIRATAPPPLPVVDLSALPIGARESEAARLAAVEARRPFDLASGPLLRLQILALGDEEHTVLVTLHHVISDGWSLGVLVREIGAMYAAAVAGHPSPLPPLAIQYADYAVWQRSWLRGPQLEARLAYWRQALAGAPTTLELPGDRPRPAVESFRGARVETLLSAELLAPLAALAADTGATPFIALLSAFAVLLGRTTGQDDLLIGTPIANRGRVEIEGLIGFFVNELVLRANLSGDPAFSSLLRRQREVVLAAFAHADLPFERLVEELRPDRDLSRNPLFQVAMVFNESLPPLDLPGLRLSGAGPAVGTSKMDLTLFLQPRGDGLAAMIEYSTDLFDRTTVERLAAGWVAVLTAIGAAPNRPLSLLDPLSADERRQIVAASAAPFLALPDSTVDALIAERARRHPEAEAVVGPGLRMSWRDLECRTREIAGALRLAGVGPEVPVAIDAHRTPATVASILGALRAGGAYVPIDPDHPSGRSEAIIADCGARQLRLDDRAVPEAAPLPGTAAGPEHLAYVIYTSGSTGRPKGVRVTHRNLLASTLARFRFYPEPVGRFLLLPSFAFDSSVAVLFWTLCQGGTLVLPESGAERDPARLLALVAAERMTHWLSVPSLWSAVLDGANRESLSSLSTVIVAGEACPPGLIERHARLLPDVALVNEYGPTEGTVWATACRLDGRPLPAAGVPIGKPIAGSQAWVLDRHLGLSPLGADGELFLGGPGVARDYLGRPDLTAERFLPDAHGGEPGARLYRTGDRVRHLEDGEIVFHGRLDHQVKVRGFRVEPAEVEAVLARHPKVRACAVAPFSAAAGETRLAAYVVLDTLAATAEADRRTEEAERIHRWRTVHDGVLERVDPASDPDHDLAGWTSSYDGRPIPAAEMREWAALAVERVRELAPRRVLEIGCGTGLLLFPLAPCCERYVGTDISRHALAGLAVRLAAAPLPQVELLEREAADFSGFAPGEFDTIVLNSVVQYFPSGEYLLRVLEGAARLLAPGGAVFLGDVRSLPLLPAFYSSLELARSPGLSAAELDRRIEERLRNEEELAVSPELFPALSRRLPGLTSWSVRTKEGKIDNELSRYRYDVVLHFDPESPADPLDAPVRPWESFTNAPLAAGRDVLAELRGYLSAALPPAFVPSHWISLDSLPLNPNGKLDRGALPVPGGERSGVGGGFVAPRGGDESTIARIFAEVLGVDRVGARDGFFDLGGHSLLATQAIARLNSAFQTVLPLQTLFEKPTPEALAVELQALRCGGTAAGPSLLVPLRPEGTRPPLVLFHAAGGTVFRYAALARRLPTGWPVWGVRAQGAEGEAQPLDSIEAMADLYARELRTLASRGALTLAGWSLGGVVAYETARRLVHFGVSVAAVVLIDSRCPADDEPEVSAREAYARELGVAPAEVDPDQLGHSFRVFAANLAARSRWRPSGPVQGRLVLLRAAGSAPRVPGGAGDPTLGWGAAVENPIEAQEIPGTHVSILAEPHVETLAARLASLLGGHSSKGEIS